MYLLQISVLFFKLFVFILLHLSGYFLDEKRQLDDLRVTKDWLNSMYTWLAGCCSNTQKSSGKSRSWRKAR